MSPCFISPRLLSLLPISFAIFERLHTRHFREQILSRMLNKCGFSHQDTGELLLRGNISLQNYKKLCRKNLFSRIQRWARSRSLILILKITTGDLDLLGDLDQFQIDLDLWVIFDLWSSIFKIIFIPNPNMYIVVNFMAKTFHYNIIHGGPTGFNSGYWSIIQRCEKLFQRDWNFRPQCSQATWPAHAQPISQFLKV